MERVAIAEIAPQFGDSYLLEDDLRASLPECAGKRQRRRRWLIALIATALVAGPAAGYYFGVLFVAKSYSIPSAARYSRVEIWNLAIQGVSSYPEISDVATVNTFHSLFTADAAYRLPSAGKISRRYILRFVLNRPAGVYSDAPETIEVWDSPNSAGTMIDAIRSAKVAKDLGQAGPVEAASAYFMKSPPVQKADHIAREELEAFLQQV